MDLDFDDSEMENISEDMKKIAKLNKSEGSEFDAFRDMIEEAKDKYDVKTEEELKDVLPAQNSTKHGKLQLVKMNGLALTENGSLTRTKFFDNLQADEGRYDDIMLTGEESKKLSAAYRHMSTGVNSVIPITCTGSECPFRDTCEYYLMDKEPMGKPCLTTNAYVKMADGSDKRINHIEVGDIVLSVDTETHSIVESKVINTMDNGVKPVYRIRTKTGYEIECTSDHEFYIIKEAKHNRKPTTRKNEIASKPLKKLKHEWLSIDDGISSGHKIAIPLHYPTFGIENINDDICKIIGYHLGDGSYLSHQLTFSNTNFDYTDEYLESAGRLGSTDVYYTEFSKPNRLPSRTVNVTSSRGRGGLSYDAVRRMMEIYGLAQKHSLEKRIPSQFFTADKKSVALMLNRFWSADGSIGEYNGKPLSNNTQMSKELLEDTQELLLRFGVRSRIRPKKGKIQQNWVLIISDKQSIINFVNEIGPIYGKEEQSIKALESAYRLSDVLNNIENDIKWDYIKDIEYIGEENVYDIEVENTHNFFANHILTHNCLIERDLLIYHTKKFFEEFDVKIEDHSEVMLVQELAELIIYEMRLTRTLSAKGTAQQMMGYRTKFSPDGEQIEEETSHWAWDLKERIKNRRMKLLDALNATRKAKASNNKNKSADAATYFDSIKEMKDLLKSAQDAEFQEVKED